MTQHSHADQDSDQSGRPLSLASNFSSKMMKTLVCQLLPPLLVGVWTSVFPGLSNFVWSQLWRVLPISMEPSEMLGPRVNLGIPCPMNKIPPMIQKSHSQKC